MATDTAPESTRATGRALLSLTRSLIAFAGRRGASAALYVALGAVFESVGLILLIPLLGIVIGGGGGQGLLASATARVFAAFSITTTFGRLSLLMGGFAVLMVIRGIVIALRDTTVVTLQVEFVEHLRAQIAGALASAGWDAASCACAMPAS